MRKESCGAEPKKGIPRSQYSELEKGIYLSSLRELSATRLIEVARCARFEPLIESFMLLLGRVHRDELQK